MISPETLSELRKQARELSELPKLTKPKIKILLYTDAPADVVKEPTGRFGLGRMIQHLEAHEPAFAKVSVKWAGRYSRGSERADNKIHVVMDKEVQKTNEPFDEIWFFGVHQINRDRFDVRLGGGTPESELDQAEIDALKIWMDQGGGVLVTGDHADPRPPDAIDPPDSKDKFRRAAFLGLGRALGRGIPRAGLMRDWEGPPTSREKDSNNTQILTSSNFDNFDEQIPFQRDRVPQQLILQTFDELGLPSQSGQPHPLFFYRPGHLIQLFPDHLHEGQVTVSQGRNDPVWPTEPVNPMPQVVAFGTDKRTGKRIKLLAAYDGDGANVGRIVADSSWHHYFNINLALFEIPAREDTASDQIGQFYGNLAVWLCPARKRLAMAAAMAETLARDPVVKEYVGATPSDDKYNKKQASALAHRLLSIIASPCEIHELLKMATPQLPLNSVSSASISLSKGSARVLPSKESLLSGIINQYPPDLFKADYSNLSNPAVERIRMGFARAWDEAIADQDYQLARTIEVREKFKQWGSLLSNKK